MITEQTAAKLASENAFGPVYEEVKFFVSPNGSDKNEGTAEQPFKTLEKAVEAAGAVIEKGLTKPLTVYLHGGEYNMSGIVFTDNDSGTKEYPVTYKAVGDGEVILNGGKIIKGADFKKPDRETLERLNPDARDRIFVCDLSKQGLTREMIGEVYAIGVASLASKYNDGTVGKNRGVYLNGSRLNLARYPNTGYLKTGSIEDPGETREESPRPKGPTFSITSSLADKIKSWKTVKDVWAFGYFNFDWAEDSNPIAAVDTEKNTIKLAHASSYGIKSDRDFYIFNVLEELDCEGEYYIDRENMLLYVYVPENISDFSVSISVFQGSLISGEISNAVFEGLTLMGVCENGIKLSGNNVNIRNCIVRNVEGVGIEIDGMYNSTYGCEVAYVGRGGIRLTHGPRGDYENLTPCGNAIENCNIHNFADVFRTYNYGAWVGGVGAKIIHNEIYDCPHAAIAYYGNDILVAYNYVHDAVYESADAGALYVGGSWSCYGNLIKFNKFENIGKEGISKDFAATGVYFDDGMSGQTAYGNIIINAAGNGFLIGGGRDVTIENNVVIDCKYTVFYDDRIRDIYHKKGKAGIQPWIDEMCRFPFRSELWKERYPKSFDTTFDESECESERFPANPARSIICNNIFMGANRGKMPMSDSIPNYSTIENNLDQYERPEDLFKEGTFEIRDDIDIPFKFETIPVNEIGRYKTE